MPLEGSPDFGRCVVMPKIIISYRRSDSDAIAGRIRDRLVSDYGRNSIFMDIDNIPFGTDFREHIQKAIAQNDLLLAIVGPKWSGVAKGGRARIDDEMDLVRIEIETAMKEGIPVIPVLVNGAKMPKPEELPASLKDFSFKNAADVDTGRDFHQHMDRLVRSINKLLNTGPYAWLARWVRSKVAIAVASIMALAAVIAVIVVAGLDRGRVGAPIHQGPTGPSLPRGGEPQAAGNAGETVVDFSRVNIISAQPVAARPYLHQFGISVVKLVPDNSEIVLVNNRGLYGGAAVVPTYSENILTQISTGNVPASFTLLLSEPVDSFSFVRPQLYRDTKSGVTHPAWTATALDANGTQLSAQSEGLFRSLDAMPGDTSAHTYTLRTPNFDRIASVRFDSDPRLNGVPFAAFSTLLIERIVLLRRAASAGR